MKTLKQCWAWYCRVLSLDWLDPWILKKPMPVILKKPRLGPILEYGGILALGIMFLWLTWQALDFSQPFTYRGVVLSRVERVISGVGSLALGIVTTAVGISGLSYFIRERHDKPPDQEISKNHRRWH